MRKFEAHSIYVFSEYANTIIFVKLEQINWSSVPLNAIECKFSFHTNTNK